MPRPEDFLNNFGQQKPQGLLGRFPQPAPAPTQARAPSFAGNDITAPRTPIFSTGTPKNIPTGVANPAQPEQSFWAGDQGQATLMSILRAGNMMQQTADPEGRRPFTRLTAGVEQGLNTYDTIRRSQTLRKREEERRVKLAAAGQAPTPLAQSQALARVGFETDDPTLAASGLKLTDQFTPDAPDAPAVRSFGAGQGLYDETGKIIREPTEKAPTVQNIGGIGRLPNPNFNPDEPPSEINPYFLDVTERAPESFTLGTGARRYEIGQDGKARIVAEGREPLSRTGQETDAQMQEINKINKIENIVWDNAKTIPKPPKTVHDRRGYLVANPNYESGMVGYNRQVDDIRERVYEAYGVKNPAAPDEAIQNMKRRTIQDVTLPGEAPTEPTRPSFEEFAVKWRAANPDVELEDKDLKKRYRTRFKGK